MESKQEIGKFFRAQLDNIDKTPNDHLWLAIDQDLKQRKRKRLLFWLLPIAAVLGSSIFMVLKTNVEIPVHQIDKKENVVLETKKDTLKPRLSDKELLQHQNNSRLVNTIEQKNSKKAGFSTTKKSSNVLKLVQESKRLVRSTTAFDEYEITKKYRYSIAKNQSKNKFVAKQKSKKIWAKNKKKSDKTFQKKQVSKSKLKMATAQNNQVLVSNPEVSKLDLVSNINTQNIDKQKFQPEIELNLPKSKPALDTVSTNKKGLQTEIKKPVKTAKKEVKTKKTNDENLKKIYLYVTPFIGVTKMEPSQSVNPFSDQYSTISTAGNVTNNYGVYLRAMFFKKLGLRIGVGKQNVGYESTITRNQNSLFDFRNIDLQITTTEEMLNSNFVNENEITYLQKTGYYNFPAQIYFVLNDNKFGFSTAAGLDFMILGDNTLSVKSNLTPEFILGKAKHLEKVSFAATLDLIFSYKLTKDVNLELCPNLKYQFKGYNRTNNFEPLILTLQTGFSYKF